MYTTKSAQPQWPQTIRDCCFHLVYFTFFSLCTRSVCSWNVRIHSERTDSIFAKNWYHQVFDFYMYICSTYAIFLRCVYFMCVWITRYPNKYCVQMTLCKWCFVYKNHRCIRNSVYLYAVAFHQFQNGSCEAADIQMFNWIFNQPPNFWR